MPPSAAAPRRRRRRRPGRRLCASSSTLRASTAPPFGGSGRARAAAAVPGRGVGGGARAASRRCHSVWTSQSLVEATRAWSRHSVAARRAARTFIAAQRRSAARAALRSARASPGRRRAVTVWREASDAQNRAVDATKARAASHGPSRQCGDGESGVSRQREEVRVRAAPSHAATPLLRCSRVRRRRTVLCSDARPVAAHSSWISRSCSSAPRNACSPAAQPLRRARMRCRRPRASAAPKERRRWRIPPRIAVRGARRSGQRGAATRAAATLAASEGGAGRSGDRCSKSAGASRRPGVDGQEGRQPAGAPRTLLRRPAAPRGDRGPRQRLESCSTRAARAQGRRSSRARAERVPSASAPGTASAAQSAEHGQRHSAAHQSLRARRRRELISGPQQCAPTSKPSSRRRRAVGGGVGGDGGVEVAAARAEGAEEANEVSCEALRHNRVPLQLGRGTEPRCTEPSCLRRHGRAP